MCGAYKNLDEGGWLVCDTTHSDEWHYDEIDNVTWKEGRHAADQG